MKIQVLRNLGRDLPGYSEGQVVDAPDEEAERLIELGLAVPHRKVRGVPVGTTKGVSPEDASEEKTKQTK